MRLTLSCVNRRRSFISFDRSSKPPNADFSVETLDERLFIVDEDEETDDELNEEDEVDEKDCCLTLDEALACLTTEDDSFTEELADCWTETEDWLTLPSAAGTTAAPSCDKIY